MTIDEYAAFESANGTHVAKVDGIWWKRVRPFFYQPLFPLLEIVPGAKKAPVPASLGGYQHVVPRPDMANSWKNFIIWNQVAGYSIEKAERSQKTNIKKGLKYFSAKRMVDVEKFITEAYPVYLSFYERTHYGYKKERTDKEKFAQWARVLFRFPKVKVLGAYHEAQLSAVHISYLVEGVLIEATAFSSTDQLKYQVSGFMNHVIRENAAAGSNIRFLYEGAVSGNKGLDEYKLRRGCEIISKPAYYQLNPVAEIMLEKFMKKNYAKLIGTRTVPCGSE